MEKLQRDDLINHEKIRLVRHGEDRDRFQTTNVNNLGRFLLAGTLKLYSRPCSADGGFSLERNCVLRRWESETLK